MAYITNLSDFFDILGALQISELVAALSIFIYQI
jgi:hypothetical protein